MLVIGDLKENFENNGVSMISQCSKCNYDVTDIQADPNDGLIKCPNCRLVLPNICNECKYGKLSVLQPMSYNLFYQCCPYGTHSHYGKPWCTFFKKRDKKELKIIIKSIEDIIKYYDEITKDLFNSLVIFITTKDYDYEIYNSIVLRFDDVSESEKGFVKLRHARELKRIDYSVYDLLLIGCDAGMSRSPAVAAVIYRYIGNDEEAEKILKTYQYLNGHVYDYLNKNLCSKNCKLKK